MKPYRNAFVGCTIGFLVSMAPVKSNAQTIIIDIIKLVTTKAIKAVDLQVQRWQNRTIDLQNWQKELENKLTQLKLDEITDWTRKQKEIYEDYFEELWQVKAAIAYYKRITGIIHQQTVLVQEYKRAWGLLQGDKHFSRKELDHIYSVYSGMIDESLKSLDNIILLTQSFTVQMSDADRLELLNRAADDIEKTIMDLRAFTHQNRQTSLRRAKDLRDLESIKQLYGLPH